MPRTILVTGASSGIGALTARELARAGHVVWAGMRATGGRNAAAVVELEAFAVEHAVSLRAVELDVVDDASVRAAVATVGEDSGDIDVVVHNAGHLVTGPTEAFTPEQIAQLYDVNVLGTQRVNRAVLPSMRRRGEGLLVWISSTSVRGGTPPYLTPYFAAKAAMDTFAVQYAAELARFGIDTAIVVPGAFTSGTNHFANAGHPEDQQVADAYEQHYAGLTHEVGARLAAETPEDADVGEVARVVARIVDLPKGERPLRTHVDPLGDGSQEVSDVYDAVRAAFLERIGLRDLLTPRTAEASR